MGRKAKALGRRTPDMPCLLALGWRSTGMGPLAPCTSSLIARPSHPHPPQNPEDLPGCSGAGLFESHPSVPLVRAPADYARDAICTDEAAALRALWLAALAAAAAERALGGGAQDVEGGIDGGWRPWVLQSRAQA
jgi:hypothetical protein